MKLYCHFHNNNKVCPYDKECVYLHEESGLCKYMEICEGEYCMYKHESADVDEESEQEEGSVNSDDNTNDEENVDDNETDRTFCNPSQSEESEVEEGKEYKCDMCTFRTEDKKRFTRHAFESHSVQGKYACMTCKSEFETRKLFTNHKYFAH